MTLEELYQENYPIVYGYLLSLCGSKAQAEDLASETFLRAIQKPGKYDGCCNDRAGQGTSSGFVNSA